LIVFQKRQVLGNSAYAYAGDLDYGNGRTRDVARLGVGKGATVVESVTRSRANSQTALRGCHAAMPNGRPMLMKLSMKTKR